MTMRKSTKALLFSAAIATTVCSGIASAELTANASALSNYIFRGTTYSGDSAVVQGGIDWSNDSGAYVGTWVSTLGSAGLGGNEIDFYSGYAGKAGKFTYDIGVLTYQYTSSPEFNYTEAYFSTTYNIFTIGANYTIDAASGNKNAAFDQGDVYLFASADFNAGPVDVSIYAGSYNYSNDGDYGNGDISYAHVGASLSKDGFSFAIDKSDVDQSNAAVGGLAANMDAVRFTISYSLDFELK
tara:strand:+ start:5401 stop:6123 length:723 start_codon:yes stop_codon:yes gene_type:complete